jgi:hypothetical protein
MRARLWASERRVEALERTNAPPLDTPPVNSPAVEADSEPAE